MRQSAAGGHGKGRRRVAGVLLASVLLMASGCANQTWTFGATRKVAGEDYFQTASGADRPSLIVLVPFVVWDIFVFPVAIVHDLWPRSQGHGNRDEASRE